VGGELVELLLLSTLLRVIRFALLFFLGYAGWIWRSARGRHSGSASACTCARTSFGYFLPGACWGAPASDLLLYGGEVCANARFALPANSAAATTIFKSLLIESAP
jgi:hypothetical protein